MSRVIAFGMKGEKPKYGNEPALANIDGKREKFASRRELDCYNNLRFLQSAARIRNLQRQVPYRLEVGGKLVCKYIADFVYEEYVGAEWKPVVADAKGYPTPMYKLKKKLMLACLGIEIREM